MAYHGKRVRSAYEGIDRLKAYGVSDAVKMVKSRATAKFDETIELSISLGVDTRHADQNVRGVVSLPSGTGKKVRVAVFAKGPRAQDAQAAGADIVGAEDLAEKVLAGQIDFDRVIAAPDMMAVVGKLGKVLGPRGLMPNPKAGTITNDLERTIAELKSGRVEFKVDKAAIIHLGFAKASFTEAQIVGNLATLLDAVNRSKPTGLKGTFIKGVSISASMGPGVAVDVPALLAVAG